MSRGIHNYNPTLVTLSYISSFEWGDEMITIPYLDILLKCATRVDRVREELEPQEEAALRRGGTFNVKKFGHHKVEWSCGTAGGPVVRVAGSILFYPQFGDPVRLTREDCSVRTSFATLFAGVMKDEIWLWNTAAPITGEGRGRGLAPLYRFKHGFKPGDPVTQITLLGARRGQLYAGDFNPSEAHTRLEKLSVAASTQSGIIKRWLCKIDHVHSRSSVELALNFNHCVDDGDDDYAYSSPPLCLAYDTHSVVNINNSGSLTLLQHGQGLHMESHPLWTFHDLAQQLRFIHLDADDSTLFVASSERLQFRVLHSHKQINGDCAPSPGTTFSSFHARRDSPFLLVGTSAGQILVFNHKRAAHLATFTFKSKNEVRDLFMHRSIIYATVGDKLYICDLEAPSGDNSLEVKESAGPGAGPPAPTQSKPQERGKGFVARPLSHRDDQKVGAGPMQSRAAGEAAASLLPPLPRLEASVEAMKRGRSDPSIRAMNRAEAAFVAELMADLQ